MPLSSGIQFGLEMTNVAAPLGGVLSRMCSLALVDALKHSGSDIITEEKMSALFGRHRIDESMKKLFKHSVAPSNQMNISKYVDIALHSGAGPTVREALRDDNPSHLSMVLQLSLLSFACQDETLAYAITTAIRSILKSSGHGPEQAPDYVSLLGTIRACRQQTTAFQWDHYFADVQSRLRSKVESFDEPSTSPDNRALRKRKLTSSNVLLSSCVQDRSIPYHTLKALIQTIPSFQHFPDEHRLHIKTSTGLCTLVVWCYYVLGISVTVWLERRVVHFGDAKPQITLEAVEASQESTLLQEAVDQSEPVFTFSPSLEDPPVASETRVPAFGFAKAILEPLLEDEKSLMDFTCWTVANALTALELERKARIRLKGLLEFETLTEMDVIKAAKFVFALEKLPEGYMEWAEVQYKSLPARLRSGLKTVSPDAFFDLIFAIARVRNIEDCTQLPLSTKAFYEAQTGHSTGPVPNEILSLMQSFEYVAHLLVGKQDHEDYASTMVLRSAWGWSTYLSCFTDCDPDNFDVAYFFIKPGVPTREGTRRTRIIDAPSREGRIAFPKLTGNTIDGSDNLNYFAGISSAKRGPVLVGNHDEHTFSVMQVFHWKSIKSKQAQEYRLGFRQMLELRTQYAMAPACGCDLSFLPIEKQLRTLPKDAIAGIEITDVTPQSLIRSAPDNPEKIFKAERVPAKRANKSLDFISRTFFYYVTHDEAARWLQMSDFVSINAVELTRPASYAFAHRKCCVRCAVETCRDSMKAEHAKFIGLVLL